MRAGVHVFAVCADETDGHAQQCPKPTPLPHAPRAVLGVVCVRGRMRTVLDPLALVNSQDERDAAAGDDETQLEEETQPGNETQRREEARPDEERQALFVTLRGDEQLALAVERVEGIIRVPVEALAPSRPPPRPLRATLEHEGTRVFVLAPSQLFDAAMQGTERRRQRQGQ